MVATVVNERDPLLLVIAGPTASGKSALAVEMAERLNGEVVSCDSVAVYEGMDIGSAKPTADERARVPHHMIDVVTPDIPYTAGEYGRQARAVIANLRERGKVPVVAGGTGLYLRALLDGLSAVAPRDEELRALLREKESVELHHMLAEMDAAAAARIHANDKPKLLRAIEVCMLEQKPISEAWRDAKPEPLQGFRVVKVGLNPPRKDLYTRINARAAQMFADGLVRETRELVARYGFDCRAFTTLGYAQAIAEIHGEMTRAEAVAAAQQGHRNYAKRQLTWFRKVSEMQWIESFGTGAAKMVMRVLTE